MSLNRREWLKTTGIGALSVNAQEPRRRPNVLFLFADDMRFDTIHALGNREIATPNLDRLARNGVAFTNAYIMGGTIGAVCVPSRAMLMTGQTLFHIHDSIVAPRPGARPFDLFPEVFRKSGYVTFGTGKWHNPPELHARAFAKASNIFFGGMSDHDAVPVQDFDPSGRYDKGRTRKGGKFSSELFSDSVIEFLREHRGPDPFLAYVAYTAPHDPRTPPAKYAAMYPPEKISLPPNFLPEHPFDNGEMKVRDEALAPWPRTEDVVRRHTAEYYAMVTHLDAEIGRVLNALDESGHASNTIVVFAADNGLAVGRHGLFGKQNLYDHSMHVPLIIGGPGLPRGARREQFAYLFDLFPTLCDLTGIAAPSTVEGTSLVPAIRSANSKSRESMFFAYRNVQRAVRTRDWKLIRYTVKDKETTQLFHLKADPWERVDLAAKEPARLQELTALLEKWMREVDDPLARRPG